MTYLTNKTGKFSGDCGGKTPPSSYPFAWSLTTNETVLTITTNGQVNNWTILQLDATTLKVSYEDTDKNGLSYVRTDTYTKK